MSKTRVIELSYILTRIYANYNFLFPVDKNNDFYFDELDGTDGKLTFKIEDYKKLIIRHADSKTDDFVMDFENQTYSLGMFSVYNSDTVCRILEIGVSISEEMITKHSRLIAMKRTPPVIYQIINKTNGMSYVGKTEKIFSTRWYQHVNNGDSYIGRALRSESKSNFRFDILEEIILPDEINTVEMAQEYVLERERFYIRQFDCVKNGYNKVCRKMPDNYGTPEFESFPLYSKEELAEVDKRKNRIF